MNESDLRSAIMSAIGDVWDRAKQVDDAADEVIDLIALDRQQRGEPVAKRLIGWRSADYLMETSDRKKAENWQANIEVLPIFEGDPHTQIVSPQPAAPAVKESLTVAEPVKGTPIRERIAKMEQDPKKKAALDRARERLRAGEIRVEMEPFYVEQPAEPVKVPSNEEIHDVIKAAAEDAALHDRIFTDIELARAILARYGQPAQPAVISERLSCRNLTDQDMDRIVGWLSKQEAGDIGFQGLCERIIQAFAASVAAQPSVPARLEFRGEYARGWNECLDAMLSAAPTPPAAAQAQQAAAAVTFVHELAMGAYKPEEIDARSKQIARMAPLEAQQGGQS